LIPLAGLTSIAAALLAAGAFAAPTKTVVIADQAEDVSGVLDLQKASLRLADDGRLRVVVTLVGKIEPRTMLARTGPPGSICLKVWTDEDADPAATRPDHLVCVTPRTKDELRASVFEQAGPGLPKLTGSASVRVNKSARSLVLRVSQSALGRPTMIRFAIESTRPGCERVSCVDQVPDGGAVRRFRLR
jgi:hypothetical protein